MLDKGDSVGLVACSDGFPNDNHDVIDEVENSLYDILPPFLMPYIARRESAHTCTR